MRKEWYEVDLRDRKTGNSVECIYSGPNYDEAWAVRNQWFRDNMPEWDDEEETENLVDGSDGVFAEVYLVDGDPLGVGKVGYIRRD